MCTFTAGRVRNSIRSLLLAALGLQASACIPLMVVSHARAPSERPAHVESEAPVRVAIVAKSLFGRTYDASTAGSASEDADLQELLAKELDSTGGFITCSSGECDVQIEAVLHEADDAERMEGLMLSAITLGLIPAWYDRDLIMEVKASPRGRSAQEYTERDSYTLIMWLPTAPLALFWNKKGAFRDIARKQFGRVLEELEHDLPLDGDLARPVHEK